jgi:hypothetical protein
MSTKHLLWGIKLSSFIGIVMTYIMYNLYIVAFHLFKYLYFIPDKLLFDLSLPNKNLNILNIQDDKLNIRTHFGKMIMKYLWTKDTENGDVNVSEFMNMLNTSELYIDYKNGDSDRMKQVYKKNQSLHIYDSNLAPRIPIEPTFDFLI